MQTANELSGVMLQPRFRNILELVVPSGCRCRCRYVVENENENVNFQKT